MGEGEGGRRGREGEEGRGRGRKGGGGREGEKGRRRKGGGGREGEEGRRKEERVSFLFSTQVLKLHQTDMLTVYTYSVYICTT